MTIVQFFPHKVWLSLTIFASFSFMQILVFYKMDDVVVSCVKVRMVLSRLVVSWYTLGAGPGSTGCHSRGPQHTTHLTIVTYNLSYSDTLVP